MDVDVAFTAASARRTQLHARHVCVIDVLRASSTISAALAAGAAGVRAVATVREARALRERLRDAGHRVVLAGERGGDPPAGFDLGNSPQACTRARVGGRELVLTTTNGTRALTRARDHGALRVYVGAFVNLHALVHALEETDLAPGLLLYAAGTEGRVSLEDTVCAGLIARELSLRLPGAVLSDAARVAVRAYVAAAADWPRELLAGEHVRRLTAKGYRADVYWCFDVDTVPAVGVLQGERLTAL